MDGTCGGVVQGVDGEFSEYEDGDDPGPDNERPGVDNLRMGVGVDDTFFMVRSSGTRVKRWKPVASTMEFDLYFGRGVNAVLAHHCFFHMVL